MYRYLPMAVPSLATSLILSPLPDTGILERNLMGNWWTSSCTVMVDDSKPSNNTGGGKEERGRKRTRVKEKSKEWEKESMNILYLPAEKSTQETKKKVIFKFLCKCNKLAGIITISDKRKAINLICYWNLYLVCIIS